MYPFSIITINYNNKIGLEKTLTSISSQKNKNFEFIIVDGGSTDGSVDLLRKNSKIISKYISEKDSGIYHAMNKGIKMSSGNYLIFINSGDCLVDENVTDEINKIKFDADILQGDTICTRCGEISHIWDAPLHVTCNTFYSGSLSHQSALIRRELFIKTPYDENLRIASDKKFFFEQLILRNASYRKLNLLIAKFDVEGISNQIDMEKKKQKENRIIINELPSIFLADYDDFIGNRSEVEKWAYKNRYSFSVRLFSLLLIFLNKIKRKIHLR
ncbi:MAG: glycosyltransferase [Paraprevotella sp.]|nr:glycosyltransferase [Paraprevotella sp.]